VDELDVRQTMKVALTGFFTLFCLIFSSVWMGMMAYGMGMGGMGGSLDVADFSRFWMVAPLILSILCVIAAWLPLRDGAKIGFTLFLVAATALSSLLYYDGYSKEKFLTIVLGSAPLAILLVAWLVGHISNRQANPKDRFGR
jgi:hypothetical protein